MAVLSSSERTTSFTRRIAPNSARTAFVRVTTRDVVPAESASRPRVSARSVQPVVSLPGGQLRGVRDAESRTNTGPVVVSTGRSYATCSSVDASLVHSGGGDSSVGPRLGNVMEGRCSLSAITALLAVSGLSGADERANDARRIRETDRGAGCARKQG